MPHDDILAVRPEQLFGDAVATGQAPVLQGGAPETVAPSLPDLWWKQAQDIATKAQAESASQKLNPWQWLGLGGTFGDAVEAYGTLAGLPATPADVDLDRAMSGNVRDLQDASVS